MNRKAKNVDDLLELAQSLQLPDGFLDEDIMDTCNEEARTKSKRIRNATLLDQLDFLISQDYQIGRLEELIRESAS